MTIEEALNELPKELWPKEGEFSITAQKRDAWVTKRLTGAKLLVETSIHDVDESSVSFAKVSAGAWTKDGGYDFSLNIATNKFNEKDAQRLLSLKRGDKVKIEITLQPLKEWSSESILGGRLASSLMVSSARLVD